MPFSRAVLALFLGAMAQAQTPAPPAESTGVETVAPGRKAFPATATVVPAGVLYQPLTSGQRWTYYVHNTYLSPLVYARALSAGLAAQWGNRPPNWRQGMQGYAERSASAFGVFLLSDSYEGAAAAALGHEVRYVRCGCTGFSWRAAYALSSSLFTRDRQGRFVPAAARIGGVFGAEYTARSWLPQGYQSDSRIARNVLIQSGFRSLTNALREFTPELKRLIHKK